MAVKIAFSRAKLSGVSCFLPATELDRDELEKLSFGEVYTAQFAKMRNYRFHQKFFALLGIAFDNMADDVRERCNINTMEGMLVHLKVALGHYDLMVSLDGTPIYQPKSISFAAMDELEFGKFYQDTINVVISKYTVGMDQRRLEHMVSQVMGFI
jgi:UDP-glucose 6-dehydrogenase